MTESAHTAAGEGLLEAPSEPHCTRGEDVYVLPTSYAQRRLWFLDRLEPGSALYNVPLAYRLEGPLEPPALARALRELARRHETLRTSFATEGETPVQVVRPEARVPLPVADLSGLPEDRERGEGDRLTASQATLPFDLGRGPLLRTLLVRLGGERHLFLLTFHHAVADGWSLGVLRRELSALYALHRETAETPSPLPELPPLSIQYADYAAWQEEWLEGEEMERQLAYWRRRLEGAPKAMELPLAGPRPPVRDGRGGRCSRILPREVTGALDELGRRAGATRFMVHLAAWKLLLHRLTPHAGRSDVVVGTPVAGRTLEETEGLVGLFVNTLVLRTDCSGDPPFPELLERVKEGVLEAFHHQDVPFERLVEELVPERDLSYEPLVQVSFGLETGDSRALDLAGVRTEPLEVDPGTVKLDLSLLIEARDDGLRATLGYARDLFGRADAARLLRSYETLLEGIARGAVRSLSELPVLPRQEGHQLLVEWNDTLPASVGYTSVLQQVGIWCETRPDAASVVAGGRHVTYGELDARSNRLAARLLEVLEGPAGEPGASREGAGPVVALLAGSSPETVVGALAVWKAGGAYLPLDPAYPPDRLAYMVEDSGAAAVLFREELRDRLQDVLGDSAVPRLGIGGEHPAEDGRSAPDAPPDPERLAYVIYTSGSTGRPKGVELGHRGLSNLVAWYRDSYGIDPEDRTLVAASPGFDSSVWEIWPPLASGACLQVPEEALLRAPGDLARWLGAEGITVGYLVTPLAEAVLAALDGGGGTALPPPPPALRSLVTGGDRLHLAPAPGVAFDLVNQYGPTESTVVTTAGTVAPGEGLPSIGRPIAGLRVHLLDRDLHPVPLGVPGELGVAGCGLARGYRSRPRLTARSFVPDAWSPRGEPGGRLYRTGDLARYLHDGRIDFLGRIDSQVQIRGFRVEPGEIEEVLVEHPAVREAAVVPRSLPGGEEALVAYPVAHPVSGDGEVPDAEALRAFLGERLPSYMVPIAFVWLPELPTTPNGKVDRDALPPPDEVRTVDRSRFVAPRGPFEEMVAEVWSELLGVARVGAHDDFFDLGGHSLLATRAVSRLEGLAGVAVPVRRLFEDSTVAGVAAAVEELLGRGRALRRPPLVRRELPSEPQASFAQERLWFLDRLEGPGPTYSVPGGLRLTGELRAPILARALTRVVARHDALRTTFAEREEGVVQKVAPAAPVALPLVDLGAIPADGREAEAARIARRRASRPFDLARGPLFRSALVRLGGERHLLLLAFHHAVFDGWSYGVLLRDLAELYGALLEERAPRLPELPVRYADYAVWQREWLTGEVLEEQLAYWRRRLDGAPGALELPTDRPRPPVQTYRGGRVAAGLGPEVTERIEGLARDRGATPFMVLLAGFAALLSRVTGGDDLPVGTPVAGRTHQALEPLVGFFVNTLVLRADLAGDPPFGELVGRVRETALDAWARQDLPFEKLVEALAPDRDPSHSPLFQVLLTFQGPLGSSLPGLAGVEAEPYATELPVAKFDLSVGLSTPAPGEPLRAELEYNRDLFDATTARRLLGGFATLLGAATADAGRRLSELPTMGPAERHQLLAEWNDTTVDYPGERSIPELFAEQAERRPEAIALHQRGESGYPDRWWSYGELAIRAGRVARRLSALGVGPETLVGLAAERSPEMVAALLGILEAGGAYLPLDPDYPPERLAFMLEDGEVPVLLASEGSAGPRALERPETRVAVLEETLRGGGVARSEAAPGAGGPRGPGSLAYVLYTSGSTGRPKGVAVEDRSVIRLIRGASFAAMGPEEVFLQLAPVPFDASTLEIWGSLLNGGRLELFPPGVPDLGELGRELEAARVTTLWLTAGLFHRMVEAELPRLAGVRQLLAGGDVLSPPHVERVLSERAPGQALINGYGPTEGTTFTCCHRMAAGELPRGESIPVGRPISNTRVYLADPAPARGLAPAPVGVPGELYLGGDGVARGYLARPALTAAAFVPDPFSSRVSSRPGTRLYRTGDLARWLPGGEVEFLGRIDHQVKLRGFRVELGEIESVLATHPAVRTAAVAVHGDRADDGRLAAWVVPAGDRLPDPGELRAHLGQRLPDYMVPAFYGTLEELPLDPNGKVDRSALPAPEDPEGPESGRGGARGGFVGPRGPLEELVAEAWSDVLGSGPVGVHDDFFDLGGHSLLATRVTSRIERLTGVALPLRRLFESPTVAALARALEGLLAEEAGDGPGKRSDRPGAPPLECLVREGRREADGSVVFPASFAQERLWFLGRFGEDRAQYNVPFPLRIEGPLEAAPLARALAEIVRRHEALRTVFARRDAEVVQRVLPPRSASARPGGILPVVDLSTLPAPARGAEARRLTAAEARTPFDLARGPLLRTRLVRLAGAGAPAEHRLLVSMHHIVSDGWSMTVFFRELELLYAAFREGRPPPPELPPLAVQYADFAVWQRRWLSGEVLERQIAYWRERLDGAPALLELPTDRPRPPVQTVTGGEVRFTLPAGILTGLRELSRERGVSLFMTLLAGLQTLLGRLAGTADVSVGAPIAGRTRSEVEDLIGFFVNTLVFRADLSHDPPFTRLLARTREGALDAYAHQDLPFEKLVEELRPDRNLAHSPLFQVMLAVHDTPPSAPELAGARAVETVEGAAGQGAMFDLTLGLAESADGLAGQLVYNRDLFDATTVRRLAGHLGTLLASAVEAPDRPLSELALLAPGERHQIVREWNDTAADVDPGGRRSEAALLHAPLEGRAAERPDAVAVVGPREHLSYGALEARSSRLARVLAARGVRSGTLVGVHLGRSPSMAVAVLAVAKAGGAYVPLEAGWPVERIRWIVSERGVGYLVTDSSRLETVAELEAHLEGVVLLDEPPEEEPAGPVPVPADPGDLAYVIFTSGSTGRPKGVVVRHRPAANLVSWVNRTFSVGPDDRLLFVTALSFDLSVYDLFGTLAAGGTVRLATEEELEDPVRQVEVLVEERITLWDSAPAALQHLAPLFPGQHAAGDGAAGEPALRRVFLSGDWVPLTLPDQVRRSFPGARVVALGGATEATVWSNWFPVEEVSDDWASIPYGRPIANARYHVLDAGLRPCPVGVAGDLHIAGGCLSSGYAGSPVQTAASYLPDPFSDDPGSVLYRTGDRARYFPDGNLEFLGRLDTQVKVRGFRIELGEIEAVLLEHPGVAEAVVLAREDVPGDQRLVTYWIPSEEGAAGPEELRRWVARKLPEYMVPAAWVERESWPLSATGKLDRKALPAPRELESAGAAAEAEEAATGLEPAGSTELERTIAAVWREVLGVESVPRQASFFDLGGHSLLLARVHERLEEELARELSMVELFRNPTVASLAEALTEVTEARPEEELGTRPAPEATRPRRTGAGPVAVVGMAGRFPGAPSVDSLWESLRSGVESIRFFSDEELAEAGFDPEALRDPSLVKARGALDGPDLFDASFFGYSPREAEVIDPQQRLFLESAWQALEDAGYGSVGASDRRRGDLSAFDGEDGASRRVGVFGGTSESGYLHRLRSDPELAQTVGGHQLAISNHPDYLATRVSYKLHLTGPSVAVQTACSTSLVAVHLACRSLLEGDCDLALAGGASVRAREVAPYRYTEGGIASPDGHTRAFDAGAAGVVSGSGVGVVALKRLEDALADGDTIRAVIRGSAVNNDGGLKAGFTAPSAAGQAEVIREALEAAGVEPGTVGYVEAHGTATPMGDPIEVEGLTRAFDSGAGPDGKGGATARRESCALGSIKTNLGHLDAAAGVAGLIKAVLALEHREIPPSLHFQEPNPEIDFEAGPFFVADRLLPFEANGAPRRAGVSSFGIGGTNAHAVLEEAPPPGGPDEAGPAEGAGDRSRPGPARSAELLVLSARSEAALDRATEELARRLRERPEIPLADAAWTLQAGRRAFPWRRAVVAPSEESSRDGFREALAKLDRRWSRSGLAPEEPPRVAFLFPGQGAQFPGMGEALYREEPVFREALDRCAEVLEPEIGLDLRELLYPEEEALFEEAAERLAATELTQPVLFAVEHALAELWASWGVVPAALVGHSLGEYTAATRAGVFELEDALRLVAARGRLMGSRPGGAMLGVRLSEEELGRFLDEDDRLALAAVNAPDATVASGPSEAVAGLRERLEADGVGCRPLHTSHAFHSGAMEPVVEPFRELVARFDLRPPEVPFASNVTGTWITAEEATDPAYWARQLVSPVRFADGLAAIVGESEETAAGWALLEVGPGRTLTTLARGHRAAVGARVLARSTRHPRQAGSDAERMLVALGALWVAGVEPDWGGHHRGLGERVCRRRVPLPTYPFERRSFWAVGGLPGRREEHPVAPAHDADRDVRWAGAEAGSSAEPGSGSSADPLEELSEAEAAVAAAFRDLLGVEEAGREDDFFELGGSSLMAVQLGSRLRKDLGPLPEGALPSDLLLRASTVGELAALVEERRSAPNLGGSAGEAPAASSCLVPLRRTGSRRPLFLVHQVGGHVYSFRPLVKALPADQPVHGLRSRGLEAGEEPLPTIEAMAEHYLELVQEAQPRGPYRIGGASMGGMVAFEMARRLRDAGEAVELLVLMDTPCGDQMPPEPEDDYELTAPVFAGRVELEREELAGLDLEGQLRHAVEKLERETGGQADLSLEEARRLATVLRANVRALFDYRPQPWDGRMLFFRARERRPGDPPRPELPWIELAPEGTEIVLVPGDHATMHEPPGVEVMASRLASALGERGRGG